MTENMPAQAATITASPSKPDRILLVSLAAAYFCAMWLFEARGFRAALRDGFCLFCLVVLMAEFYVGLCVMFPGGAQ